MSLKKDRQNNKNKRQFLCDVNVLEKKTEDRQNKKNMCQFLHHVNVLKNVPIVFHDVNVLEKKTDKIIKICANFYIRGNHGPLNVIKITCKEFPHKSRT